jgi:hypothetical protein
MFAHPVDETVLLGRALVGVGENDGEAGSLQRALDAGQQHGEERVGEVGDYDAGGSASRRAHSRRAEIVNIAEFGHGRLDLRARCSPDQRAVANDQRCRRARNAGVAGHVQKGDPFHARLLRMPAPPPIWIDLNTIVALSAAVKGFPGTPTQKRPGKASGAFAILSPADAGSRQL